MRRAQPFSFVVGAAITPPLTLLLSGICSTTMAVLSCVQHSKCGYSTCGANSFTFAVSRLCVTRMPIQWGFSCSHFLHQCRCVFNKYDAVGYAGRTRNVANAFNPLEMNLFDDPTGGLTAGPAEELSTTEIEHQVRLNVSSYSRSIFYLLYTPFVDVVSVVLERGLAPDSARPGDVICRWFTDGATTLQNPSCVAEAMGHAVWTELCKGLDAFYEDVEPAMPLTATVRAHGLPEELLVPFFRQLAMELLVPGRRRAVLEILPGLILGLANGRAPAALAFPADNQRARVVIAADLFFGVGQETGNTDFAYLAIQLLRANDVAVPFLKQKQLTNVFAAATRIQTDWQMRVSGQLVEVLPRWMEYYRKVYQDNQQAMKKLSERDAATLNERDEVDAAYACSSGAGENDSETVLRVEKRKNLDIGTKNLHERVEGNDAVKETLRESVNIDGAHGYFLKNGVRNPVSLFDLENRILQSVRKRDVAWRDDTNKLYSRFRRRKSASEEGQNADESVVMKEMSIEDCYEYFSDADDTSKTNNQTKKKAD